jgi:molecular chaperone DnaK (HSP70)
LGIGEFRGIFLKQLHRGSNLPCSNNVLLNTVIDYQESCVIEIYQGERPFSRYCNLLGTLLINDLPLDKAYKVEIAVKLSIDRDEVLTLNAIEMRKNKQLSVTMEKAKMKDNTYNLVLEALENKKEDEKLLEKLDELNDLIENLRMKYEDTEYESLVYDKMNDFVGWITERKKTINIQDCQNCIERITKYIKNQNLSIE